MTSFLDLLAIFTLASIRTAATEASGFINEIVVDGLYQPSNIEFLPNGSMLIAQLDGIIRIVPFGQSQVDPSPFLNQDWVSDPLDLALDPDFEQNHYYYLFYNRLDLDRDRVSRFTVNANMTGTVPGSELVLWQDDSGHCCHHNGGSIAIGAGRSIFITVGDHFNASDAQRLTSYHGKVLRINSDGTIPTDNPFHDGTGPNRDEIWALGLRNPFRATIDPVTGRYYITDVGEAHTEELNLGIGGANYGWPLCEGDCAEAGMANPIYSYHHPSRDASITGGIVYRGSQFPSSFQGNYIFGDYAQNWIKRLTFDANGAVSGTFNVEPADGTMDSRVVGDIVDFREGPDGSLYYCDLGFSNEGTPGVGKVRRLRFIQLNQPPIIVTTANPTTGPAPLSVSFSSAGTSDPENNAITFLWNFGDGNTSTSAAPVHVYSSNGQYTASLSVSDGNSTSSGNPITIKVGVPPVATISGPANGVTFWAGNTIAFSGSGTDAEDGPLPSTAFRWEIYFHHETHIHPEAPIVGKSEGTITIPSTGHEYRGATWYEIILTVTDSDGLSNSEAVNLYPEKVDLTFDTEPSDALTITIDGISKVAPFTLDTLVGFQHSISVPDQTKGGTSYSFASWSDNGSRTHTIIVPATNHSYTARMNSATASIPGLLAHWNFDEITGGTVIDSSGHGFNGTLVNGAERTAGHIGNGAIQFDGSDDYISLGADLDIPAMPFTFTAWLNPESYSGFREILSKRNSYSAAAMRIDWELDNGTGRVKLHQAQSSVTFNYAPPLNIWTHLAVVATSTNTSLYVNGVLQESLDPITLGTDATAPVRIGDSGQGDPFAGSIDDLRIYLHTLSAADIQQILNRPPLPASPVLERFAGAGVKKRTAEFLGTDPDGDSIGLVSVESGSEHGGTVSIRGAWVSYLPPADYAGPDTFGFSIRDSQGGVGNGTASVTVRSASPENVTGVVLVDGAVRLRVDRIPGREYVFQYLDGLSNWTDLAIVTTDPTGLCEYVDHPPAGAPSRTYRIIEP